MKQNYINAKLQFCRLNGSYRAIDKSKSKHAKAVQ
jgi:hypothetical protein